MILIRHYPLLRQHTAPKSPFPSYKNPNIIPPLNSTDQAGLRMASSFPLLLLLISSLLILLQRSTSQPMTLTLVNNCPFTVCPAIQPNSGHDVLERGGLCLQTLTHKSFPGPTSHWSGRIWARTGCTHTGTRFTCATGDCGSRLECNGLGGSPPATLAQITLHHGGPHRDFTSYSVSLVDGFNVPMTGSMLAQRLSECKRYYTMLSFIRKGGASKG